MGLRSLISYSFQVRCPECKTADKMVAMRRHHYTNAYPNNSVPDCIESDERLYYMFRVWELITMYSSSSGTRIRKADGSDCSLDMGLVMRKTTTVGRESSRTRTSICRLFLFGRSFFYFFRCF